MCSFKLQSPTVFVFGDADPRDDDDGASNNNLLPSKTHSYQLTDQSKRLHHKNSSNTKGLLVQQKNVLTWFALQTGTSSAAHAMTGEKQHRRVAGKRENVLITCDHGSLALPPLLVLKKRSKSRSMAGWQVRLCQN